MSSRQLSAMLSIKFVGAQLADDARRLPPLACRAALLRQLPSIPQIGCPFSLAPPTFRAIVVQSIWHASVGGNVPCGLACARPSSYRSHAPAAFHYPRLGFEATMKALLLALCLAASACGVASTNESRHAAIVDMPEVATIWILSGLDKGDSFYKCQSW